jgi:hypothetical protein
LNYTSAKVIADSYNLDHHGARITTFEVYAPRYLLAEINTHGVLAKSAASSRAIPVAKRVAMVQREPWVPDSFGKNCPGMQSKEALDEVAQEYAKQIWDDATADALKHATSLMGVDAHKQFANRVLEPYTYYSGVVTASEWDNFWWLRISEAADPGFKVLAQKMKEAYDASKPVSNYYHLPYVDVEDIERVLEAGFRGDAKRKTLMKLSAARGARVSYVSLETGKRPTLDEDLQLIEKLTSPTGAHLSPFDHPAFADTVVRRNDEYYWGNPQSHGRYWGWVPYRHELEKELGITCRRSSFDAIREP